MAVHVRVVPQSLGTATLNFVNGTGVAVARKSFMAALGTDAIENDLFVGRVENERGDQLEDWFTYRGRRRLIIRGSKHVSYRICEVCGKNVYFAMGKRYLYPDPLVNAKLFESHLFGLVIREDVFTQLNVAMWVGVTTERLPVVLRPTDSLGIL